MVRSMTTGWAAVLSLAMTSPLLAQDRGGPSVFSMFFSPIPNNPTALDWFGVLLVYGLILLSLVAVALIIQNFLRNRRAAILPEETVEQLKLMMSEKRFRDAIELAGNDGSFFCKVFKHTLDEASNGFPAMEQTLADTSELETTRLLRPLEYMNVLGNVAPMLGLFGTVYGMIVAFMRLVEAGGKPDPGQLAGGISTALVTTFWGLIIAMPALAAYSLLRNKIDEFTSEAVVVIEEMLKPFRPSVRRAASGSAASAGAGAFGGPAPAPSPAATRAPQPPQSPNAGA